MSKSKLLATVAIVSAMGATGAQAQDDPLQFTYIMHSSTGNVFWQAVKNGMDEACAMINAECQMIFLNQDGNLNEQLANLEATIANEPDGIITTLVNDDIFDEAVQRANDLGIPVLGSNVDDTMGEDGNSRLSFVGQDLEQAGYDLAKGLSEHFPADGPISVLLGVSGPGQSWAEQRMAGVARFMEDYAAANADREVTWERIDSGLDLALTQQRVSAYVQGNPDLTAYFDAGYWHAGAAVGLRDLGYGPGEILLGGFDLLPVVFDEMESGYIQVTVDQQPFLQGFLPIMQLYLMSKYELGAWDVNTGKSLIVPGDVPALRTLSEQGLR